MSSSDARRSEGLTDDPVVETAAEPTADIRPEPPTEPEPQPAQETDPELQRAEEPAAEPPPEPVEEPEPAREAEPQPAPEAEVEAEAQAEPEAKAQAQPEAKAQAEPEAKAQAQPEAEAKAQAEPEAAAEAVPEPEPASDAEPDPEPAADAAPEQEPQPEAGALPPPSSRGPVEGRAAWRRLLAMSRPRATRANLLGALLALLLGGGIAAQVQLTNERGLDELSQSDLVRVLDDVSVRSSRLDAQVRDLEATRDRLKNGTGTTAEALNQAQKRVDTLGILAGTVPAQGQGIVLTITDPGRKVSGPVVLDIIQEMRDAGAEAIDVGGVRVVASSFVGDAGGDILVDGTAVNRPMVIKAIGDAKTLASAMTIPGGIVETVRQSEGANATVSESQAVQITSLHRARELTHAKPVE